jgi:hypothetical protein
MITIETAVHATTAVSTMGSHLLQIAQLRRSRKDGRCVYPKGTEVRRRFDVNLSGWAISKNIMICMTFYLMAILTATATQTKSLEQAGPMDAFRIALQGKTRPRVIGEIQSPSIVQQ